MPNASLRTRVQAFLVDHPGATSSWIAKALGARRWNVQRVLRDIAEGRVVRQQASGRNPDAPKRLPIEMERARRKQALEATLAPLIESLRRRGEACCLDVADDTGLHFAYVRTLLDRLTGDGRATSRIVPLHCLAEVGGTRAGRGGRPRRYYRLVASGERAA